MYYAAWCKQNHRYFHSGGNARTQLECEQEIGEHLLNGGGLDEEDRQMWENASIDEILEMFEVEIHEDKKPFIIG